MNDSLGDRIKRYEAASKYTLPPRTCLIIRVDGRAFHTYTRGCERPFDQAIMDAMTQAMKRTAQEIMGFKLAYTQSDEATFMLTDFDRLTTQGWFGYDLNKIVSISASLFTAHFNQAHKGGVAVFDSRVFTVPIDDAPNVFLWRQRDWERNSVHMLARSHFSHKQIVGLKRPQLHDLLMSEGVNWSNLSGREKNGTFLLRDGSMRSEKADYGTLAGWIQQGFEHE